MNNPLQPLQERQDFLVMELSARTDPAKEHSPYNKEILKELKTLNLVINYLLSK